MLLAASTFSATGINTPSGWTSLLHKDNSGSWGIDSYLFGKVAGASESAPTVARTSGTGFLDATIWAYRGVSTTVPIDSAAVNGSVFSGTTTQPTIVTASANAMVVYIGFSQDPSASWGTPSGETRRKATSSPSIEQFLGIADKIVAVAGSVTGQSWASGSGIAANLIAAVALAEPAAAATFVPQTIVIS